MHYSSLCCLSAQLSKIECYHKNSIFEIRGLSWCFIKGKKGGETMYLEEEVVNRKVEL